jgi:hypothetical protein
MKEQYITMRNYHQIDGNLLYTYAREHGMTLNFQEFMAGLGFWSSAILEHLDRKFELTLLYGKDGNFIKVVQ